jgi:hypothetical protein
MLKSFSKIVMKKDVKAWGKDYPQGLIWCKDQQNKRIRILQRNLLLNQSD